MLFFWLAVAVFQIIGYIIGSVCNYTLFFISTNNFESRLDCAYHKTDSVEIFTLTLPIIMCLKCFWLKVKHLDISESSSDWAEQRFQIEIWAKPEAGGAYSGGAYIKKSV